MKTYTQNEAIEVLNSRIAIKDLPPFVSNVFLEQTKTRMFSWGSSKLDMVSLFITKSGRAHWTKPYDFYGSPSMTIEDAIDAISLETLSTPKKIAFSKPFNDFSKLNTGAISMPDFNSSKLILDKV